MQASKQAGGTLARREDQDSREQCVCPKTVKRAPKAGIIGSFAPLAGFISVNHRTNKEHGLASPALCAWLRKTNIFERFSGGSGGSAHERLMCPVNLERSALTSHRNLKSQRKVLRDGDGVAPRCEARVLPQHLKCPPAICPGLPSSAQTETEPLVASC